MKWTTAIALFAARRFASVAAGFIGPQMPGDRDVAGALRPEIAGIVEARS